MIIIFFFKLTAYEVLHNKNSKRKEETWITLNIGAECVKK